MTRLRYTFWIGILFAFLSAFSLAIFQFGVLQYFQSATVLRISLPEDCGAPINPSANIASDGRITIFFSHSKRPENEDDVPWDYSACFSQEDISVFFNSSQVLAITAPDGDVEAQQEFPFNYRSFRAGISGTLAISHAQPPTHLEVVTLSIDFVDNGFGFNPGDLILDLSWGTVLELEPQDELRILEAESFTIQNNCGGCIFTFGGRVLAPGNNETIPSTVDDLSFYGMEVDNIVSQEAYLFSAWEFTRRIIGKMSIDDPSRAALENNISNISYIILGAAFSLLTEAFLISGVLREQRKLALQIGENSDQKAGTEDGNASREVQAADVVEPPAAPKPESADDGKPETS